MQDFPAPRWHRSRHLPEPPAHRVPDIDSGDGRALFVMNDAKESKRDVWLDAGVVWAAIEGTLSDGGHQDLTQRAVAMAAETENWRLMFDYRRAFLTHDVLALSRHAELLTRLGLPGSARTAILCPQRSTNFVFWESVLGARGHVASAFTDGDAALSWLHRPAAAGALATGEAAPARSR